MTALFREIRAACAEVVERARFVRLDPAPLEALALALAAERAAPPAYDPTTHHRGTQASTLAYVLTLDAINFGSGWFPRLRKRAGRSGYYAIAMGLKDRFDDEGAWHAAELAELGGAEVARVLGQDAADPEVAELMDLYARALNQLGELLLSRFGGRFEALVDEAAGSAEQLVAVLACMPFYRDVARYDGATPGFCVPFYKRAQITAADLALAFDATGPGRFDDLDQLTAFADNLVPHVLRMEGALRFDPQLEARIEAGALLPAGSPEEVEIRAAGLHAVERLVDACARAGMPTTARELDFALWHRGQRPEMKARPRHRTRCVWY